MGFHCARPAAAIAAGSLIATLLPMALTEVASAAPTQAACENRDNNTYAHRAAVDIN